MKFTLENNPNLNFIRAYSAEELKIGEHSIRSSCIVMADQLIGHWAPATLGELQVNNFAIEVGAMDYGFAIDGIIGTDFLLQVGAVIDLSHLEIHRVSP